MKLKMTMFLALFAMIFAGTAQAQETGANYVGESSQKRVVPSLASRSNLQPAVKRTTPPNDGRSAKVEVVPMKDPQTANDFLAANPNPLAGKIPARDPLFDYVVGNSVGSPSDPALGVGPNHVFIVYNTGFMIYDKADNILQGPTAPSAIFSNNGCCDLTVSYDNLADRWVITYLFVGAGMEIAVSDGPDPLTANWNVYLLPQVNDYNKLSVWRDGYYITDNGANDVWAVDRNAALAGAPTVGIQGFNIPGVQGQNFTSAQVFNITDDVHPTTGGAPLVYMRDNGFAGVTDDSVNIWTVNVDFATPANSNVSAPEVFLTEPFINVFDGGSFSNLTQPGGGSAIDALQSTIMNQAQFRKFPTHNSAVFNFVVDLDAGAGELAGIRWYEFQQAVDGGAWTMMQEGTYSAPDGKHAWNGSMAMDEQGNIGMGYSVMAGPTTPNPTDNRVGAAYTGRFVSDPIGTMTIAEEVFGTSTANVGGTRFGDYGKLDVDPTDNQTFYFITEYRQTNHVGVFKVAPDADNDTGVVAITQPNDGLLTATETVEVTVRNFGTLPQSNVPVQFTVDGGTPVIEIVPGPIPPASNVTYVFNPGTANLSVQGTTYTIEACTALVGDEVAQNDCVSKDVTHLENDDVGVISLDAPTSGSGLSATEDVTITIQNFGASTQTMIPVFYTINGGTAVQEDYVGSIAAGMTDTYTFTTQADLSALGNFDFVAGTEFVGDADETNDDITQTVTNFLCRPESNCIDFDDGVTLFELADQDISTNCGTSPAGYSDDTSIVFNFVLEDNPFEGTLQMGFSDSIYALWIDFNDNFIFEPSELISSEQVAVANSDFDFTVDFSAIPGVTPGMHLMRLRGEDESGSGDVLNPCEDLQWGRTNDYTANITGGTLGVDSVPFADAEFIITTQPNNQFVLLFNTTNYTDDLPVYIYNTLGQNLAFYTLENNGKGYTKTIDMSYASSGVYFVKVGNENLNKVQRIIVK